VPSILLVATGIEFIDRGTHHLKGVPDPGSCTPLRATRGERASPPNTLLAPIHGWFTEGFDTRPLQDAKVLLEEL
jgi:hypothetical protein